MTLRSRRWVTIAICAAPIALCIAVYWPGIFAWFQMDDFWWLSRLGAAGRDGFWQTLLTRPGHGTYRPLSEPAFFMTFEYLFGPRPLPIRIFVFATQFANLLLLGSLARRLYGSQLAALIAPIVWLAHTSLAGPLVWSSSYNQILGATFLLAELSLFARFVDTGRRSAWVAEWLLFIVGFGVIETNLAHPIHAIAWVLCVAPSDRRRALLRRTIPLMAASAVYAVAHLVLVPRVGPYTMGGHLVPMLKSAYGYWMWTVIPMQLIFEGAQAVHHVIACAAFACLATYTLWRVRSGDRRPLLGWVFYLATLAPYLPLVQQRTPSYLSIPSIGLGLIAADAIVALRVRRAALVGAVLITAVYLRFMLPTAHATVRLSAQDTHAVERVVGGILDLRRTRTEPILIDGVSETVYNAGLAMSPFRCLGVPDVYLTDNAIEELHALPGVAPPSEYAANPADVARWRWAHTLLVLSARGDRLVDITGVWQP